MASSSIIFIRLLRINPQLIYTYGTRNKLDHQCDKSNNGYLELQLD